MKHWIPLFQSLVWPVFIGIVLWKFKPQFEMFLATLNEKLKNAKSIGIGKDGLKLSDFPDSKEKIDDATPVSNETEEKLKKEVRPELEKKTLLAGTAKVQSEVYLRHSAIRDPSLDKHNLTYFRLKFWLDADDRNALGEVEKIIYVLHPTFRNPVREVRSRDTNFMMATYAWGEFNLKAIVYFNDGSRQTLERYIDFGVSR